MKLARVIRLDKSDTQVFRTAARPGEWAISGSFEFSDWDEADLVGKQRQAFANGWLGLESFGRATFVAVSQIETAEFDLLCNRLAAHFASHYGAPSAEAALPVARDELRHMAELCEGLNDNTLFTVSRALTEAGVKETFRIINPQDARLDQIAIHAAPSENP